ncbi:transcriptional activator mut3p [Fusarium sporotrichioides]|uniref:Transcriptional activator mut3p n=1 Tax=Fusarium sporotrichioides TaxID=5514 RepID=A0A395SNZ4_FUSSP|nr:transcriptional activator mut3p [Fusarium sporotrichioides]
MEQVSSRRKACDYCVARKAKCDARKPTCSNCTLYAVTCKTTVTSKHRARPRESASQPDRIALLEERLATIESLLTVIAGNPVTQPQHDITGPINNAVSSNSFDSWGVSPGQTPHVVAGCLSTPAKDSASPPLSTPTSNLELAPLSEVLPLVDNYFRNYNPIIPLFEETAFMRMLLDFYARTSKKSIITWAAINVVVAINYRVLEGRGSDDAALNTCLQNVRSVMSELMIQGKDLMGLQVLLGVVILFLGSSELQLAIVLTGSVVKLAQSLRLNSKEALEGLTNAEKAQRTQLFWLTYIYDRRSQSPYSLLDTDTDMDLPDSDPENNFGVITSSTHSIRFNYLRAKAQFAYIQGKAYDLLYSQKSTTLTKGQKHNMILRIEEMLAEWVHEIPVELHTAEGIRERLSPTATDLMMNLWFHHAECRIKIRSIFTFEDAWVNRVRLYLTLAVIDISDDVDGEVRRGDIPPLPSGWDECVGYGRVCLELLSKRRPTEYILWLHSCGSFSCLILLIVNLIEHPDHAFTTNDRQLLDNCFMMFQEVSRYLPKEPYGTMLAMSRDLDVKAMEQVNRKRIAKDGLCEVDGFMMSPSTAWEILDNIEFQ